MGVCCCHDDTVRQHGWDDRTSERTDRTQQRTTLGDARLRTCRHCGVRISIELLDSHQEACRVNNGHRSRTHCSSELSTVLCEFQDENATEGHDENEICVVCAERLRCLAFLPCGHIGTCGVCAKQLDNCPLCRQTKQGLCYVPADTLSRYECKHCHQFIAPTLYDGHREVCGLQMRMAQRDQEALHQLVQQQQNDTEANAGGPMKGETNHLSGPPVNASSSSALPQQPAETNAAGITPSATSDGPPVSPAATTPTTTSPSLNPKKGRHLLTLCVECGSEDLHLVISLPCGHRVMCGACARKRTTCPVCLREVAHVVDTYE